MTCVQCSISPNERGEWFAKLADRTAGPYRDIDMALRIAIDEAQRIRRTGGAAHIVVYNSDRTTAAVYRLCGSCNCDLAPMSDSQIQVKDSVSSNVVPAGA